jgi:hypothetical protein
VIIVLLGTLSRASAIRGRTGSHPPRIRNEIQATARKVLTRESIAAFGAMFQGDGLGHHKPQ